MSQPPAIIETARLQALQSRDDEISRLRLGLRMIVTQEYDMDYSAEDFAQAVLDGDEPVATLKTARGESGMTSIDIIFLIFALAAGIACLGAYWGTRNPWRS